MRELMIDPSGAWALGKMVLSCGNIQNCHLMCARLGSIGKPRPLRELGEAPGGGWLKPFRSVYEYTVSRMPEAEVVDAHIVAACFASNLHIEEKLRDQLSTLKSLIGDELGFLLHVGMPLDEDLVYRNSGLSLKVVNQVDLGGEGVAYSHLGALFRIPMTKEQSEQILKEQSENQPFMDTLSKHSGEEVFLPKQYVEAIRLTHKAARD